MGYPDARRTGALEPDRARIEPGGADHLLRDVAVAIGVGEAGQAVAAQAVREGEQHLPMRLLLSRS